MYTNFNISIHERNNKFTPKELIDSINLYLKGLVQPDFDEDIEIEITEHSRNCSIEFCGKLNEHRGEVEEDVQHNISGSYKDARGCSPSLSGMSAEEAIRKGRD